MSPGRSKPSDATSLAISAAFSSNVMSTPGSSNRTAPFTRNVSARRVLPDPGPPQTSVGRPVGSPPRVTSSRPRIPVSVLARSPSRDVYGPAVTLKRSFQPIVGVATLSTRALLGRAGGHEDPRHVHGKDAPPAGKTAHMNMAVVRFNRPSAVREAKTQTGPIDMPLLERMK